MPSVTSQEDYGAGIQRGRKSLANGVWDAVNCLLDDEGQLFKRGCSAYWSTTNAGTNLARIATAFMPAPKADRVLAWGNRLYAFDASPAAVELLNWGSFLGRPAQVGGVLAFPDQTSANNLVYYGGSLKAADYAVGTSTVTAGSTAVTGAGTSWLANVDAGMILTNSGSSKQGIVAQVLTNTSLTLTAPWAGTTATAAYVLSRILNLNHSSLPSLDSASRVAAVGTPPRLVMTIGNRAYLTEAGDPWAFPTLQYLELPDGAVIVGASGIGDEVLLFTTEGVWAGSNLSFDAVDGFGNPQWQQHRISDVVLWGEAGVATWHEGLIVCGVDDIHLLGFDGSSSSLTGDPENEKIRPLYRSYTKTAGLQPGIPCVHRGHLFVPILSGATVTDGLVCRLDRGANWARWSGHASGGSYAIRAGTATRAPTLLSVKTQRVTDLSACFDPTTTNAVEADSSVPDCTITTRDYPTSGNNQPGTVAKARGRYVLTDDGSGATADPTVALAVTSDQDGGSFTTLTDVGGEAATAGGGLSDGSQYSWWGVGKRRDRVRFQITQAGACASFVWRSLELHIRESFNR